MANQTIAIPIGETEIKIIGIRKEVNINVEDKYCVKIKGKTN